MKEKHRKEAEAANNVEFSVEFGDVNGTKLYELQFMNEKTKNKSERKK